MININIIVPTPVLQAGGAQGKAAHAAQAHAGLPHEHGHGPASGRAAA